MSRWDWDERHPRAPRKPPPAHGVRLQKAGTTWWGQRWIAALEQVLAADAGRLARGKTYARAGRAHDLVVAQGTVTAQVTGTRSEPYAVTITLAQLSEDVWQQAIARMAHEAQFTAELLADQMPRRIDEVFVAVGASLFPKSRSDLETSCTCPDWGDPCKHVAATHFLLGEAFDADPFLLFELRGRPRASVLAGLRAARGAAPQPADTAASEPVGVAVTASGGSAAESGAPLIPRVRLGPLSPDDYDRLRAPLPALELTFEAPEVHAAPLRQLGLPGAWRNAATPVEMLTPLVVRAAEAARRIALAEPEITEAAPPEAAPPEATPARGQTPKTEPAKGKVSKKTRATSKRATKRRS